MFDAEAPTLNSFEEINSAEFLSRLQRSLLSRKAAFRRLVEVTHHRLDHYLRRFVDGAEDRQELLQEIYVGAFRSLDKFEGRSKLTTWLYGLAHHKACDYLSARARHPFDSDVDLDQKPQKELDRGEGLSATLWELPPDQRLERDKMRSLIRRAAESLSPALFRVYQMRDVDGLSAEEVGRALGIAPVAVRVRLHRARNAIVEQVRGFLFGKGGEKQGPERRPARSSGYSLKLVPA